MKVPCVLEGKGSYLFHPTFLCRLYYGIDNYPERFEHLRVTNF